MWDSSCSRSTQKINLQQFYGNVGGCKAQILMELGYIRELYLNSLESNLGKIGFLKLLTKENLPGCFH